MAKQKDEWAEWEAPEWLSEEMVPWGKRRPEHPARGLEPFWERRPQKVQYASFLYPFMESMYPGGGAQPWRQWFEGKFSDIIQRWRATGVSPKYRKLVQRGAYSWDTPMKPGLFREWIDYLESQRGALKEEWAARGFRARGERPRVYAPKIRAVSW